MKDEEETAKKVSQAEKEVAKQQLEKKIAAALEEARSRNESAYEELFGKSGEKKGKAIEKKEADEEEEIAINLVDSENKKLNRRVTSNSEEDGRVRDECQ